MKRILASALVVALSVGAAKAQTVAPPAQHVAHHQHRQRFKKVVEKLNLSDAQKDQLKALRSDFRKQMTDLKGQSQLTAVQMKERRKELHRNFRSKMESILTPAQKDQLQQMRTAWKSHHKGTMAFGRHHHLHLKKQLSLTEAQVAELKKMHQDTKSQFEAIRKNSSLTTEQKKAQLKELREKRQESLKTVLTAEQFQKLQDLHKERRHENAK